MARDLYRRSGEAGILEAKRRYMAFLAIGVGGTRDWDQSLRILKELARIDGPAKRQLSLIQKMKLSAKGDPLSVPPPEHLSHSPTIIRFRRLFSEPECIHLRQLAEPMYEPALTVDERTGRQIPNPIRTSDTAAFPWLAENPFVHALNRRIAAVSGTEHMQGEPLQVLRYAQGQQYRPHIDAIPGMDNQRIVTVLVYLNDDFEGGQTQFLRANLTIGARRGDAIMFSNADSNGRPDPETVHAGLAVSKGTKLLASRWIRERPITE